MTDYLKGLQQFSVQADITEDFLLDSGLKVQYGRTVTASVRRPDRLRVEPQGDLEDRQLFLDGDTATLVHLGQSQYSTLSVPTGIDAALDHLVQTYGLRAPLADLIYADAYDRLMDGNLAGFYLGLAEVHGHLCHHLPASWHRLADLGGERPHPVPTQAPDYGQGGARGTAVHGAAVPLGHIRPVRRRLVPVWALPEGSAGRSATGDGSGRTGNQVTRDTEEMPCT